MFNLGPSCHVCKKNVMDKMFRKDQDGDPLYHTNPKLSPYTDQLLFFCGPECSTKWHMEQMEARKDATQ